MLSIPRLPAVIATLCPGRTLSRKTQASELRMDLAHNVVHADVVERLTEAKDFWKLVHAAFRTSARMVMDRRRTVESGRRTPFLR